MKFNEFQKQFSIVNIITTEMIEYFFDKPNYIQRQISEWTKKERLIKIKKGLYIINDFLHNKTSLFEIANKLVEPSYISNETALSYRGLIPEGVFTITSITTKNTNTCTNKFGKFTYNHCKQEYFTGFIKKDNVLIASPEKALIDFLYYHGKYTMDDIISQYRLQGLDTLNHDKLILYARLYKQKKLTNHILTIINNDDGYSSL